MEYCTEGDDDLEGEYPDELLLGDGVLLLYTVPLLCGRLVLRVVLYEGLELTLGVL